MSDRRRLVPVGLAVAVAAAITVGAAAERKLVGELFPVFEATDAVTGEAISLETLRGKVVLVDFWATWCGPCRRELPNLRRAHERFHDKGFEIISISLDRSPERVTSFVADQSMSWPQVAEGGGWNTRLAREYEIRSIPATYLIDASGICVAQRLRGRSLEGAVERALARSGVTPPPPSASPGDAEPSPVTVLRATARQVENAGRRSRALTQRLESTRRSVEVLARELPEPAYPDTVRRRYRRLGENLRIVRREVLMGGMLGDEVVILPPDPFADGSGDEVSPGVFDAALASLPDMERAADALQPGVDEFARRVTTSRRELASVLSALETAGVGAPTLVTRTAEARDRATSVIHPWRTQLVDGTLGLDTLAARTTADPSAHERLRVCRAERDQLRSELEAAGDDAAAVAEIHDRFAALCAEVLSLWDLL